MKRLFIYLFGLAVLLNLFTYRYYSSQVKFEQERFEKLKSKLTDSISHMSEKIQAYDYFSISSNEQALDYFYDKPELNFRSSDEIVNHIKEALIAHNDNPEGNIYTGQDKIDDQKFIIEKVRVINNRWVVADFSNGKVWGEVLLKYFINDDRTVDFEYMHSMLFYH